MVLIDQMWDEVVAGPQPQRGLGKLRKVTTVNEKGGDTELLISPISMHLY